MAGEVRQVSCLSSMSLVLTILASFLVPSCNSGAVQLDTNNIDGILENNDLVLINFYADWCRFSNMLAPIWDEGADKVAQQLSGMKVVLGKVDCDKEGALGQRFHITKYPTIKYVQHGVVAKKEYRGQRSAEAFLDFVRQHVKDPIEELNSLDQVQNMDQKKRHLIGYFDSKESPDYENFLKVSRALKEDCVFHIGFDPVFQNLRSGQNKAIFKAAKAKSSEPDLTFTGVLSDYDQLHAWAQEHCSPLVREITFENAEELTEEGLPFLILFHKPEDEASVKEYTELVQRELMSEKASVNFLVADGLKFAHPLSHLGKTKDDLPLIAVDSFRHMYLFPKYENIRVPGKMKQFLQDLYSGKLHREFHYGPDKEEEKKEEEKSEEKAEEPKKEDSDEGEVKEGEVNHIPRTEDQPTEETSKKPAKKSTGPPESQFAHLGPSKNRYTILRDEF